MLIGKTLGRYEIREAIGRGGMASVYKAYDPRFQRFVAIKVLSPDRAADPFFHERFEKEMRALARLDHPNIVQIHDSGEDGGHYYMVLQYFPLGDIRSRLKGDLAPADVVTILKDVARALRAAHRLGVVHRDLKPANMLVADDGRTVLSDFGIAKLMETTHLTQANTSGGLGTPYYMAPEQVQGTGVDSRSDVYSFGVVAYHLFVGQPPFMGDTPIAVAYKHVNESFPRPSNRVPNMAPELESFVLKCVERQPDERYKDGGAVLEALEGLSRFVADGPDPFATKRLAIPAGLPSPSGDSPGGVSATIVSDAAKVKARRKPRTKERRLPRIWKQAVALSGVAAITVFVAFSLLRYGGGTDSSVREPSDDALIAGPSVSSSAETAGRTNSGEPVTGTPAATAADTSGNKEAIAPVDAERQEAREGKKEPATTAQDDEANFTAPGATLVVRTTPSTARVLVDGIKSALGPEARFLGLSAGAHDVEVRLNGYISESRSVTLVKNGRETLIVALSRPREDDSPEPPSASAATASKPGGETAPRTGKGTLEIRANAISDFFVNDELRASKDSMATVSLDPGRYDVRVESAGNAPIRDGVTIEAGRKEKFTAAFPKKPGSIRVITGDGAWGYIVIDGEPTQKAAPRVLRDIPAGRHLISLVREGFTMEGDPVVVIVEPGEIVDVDLSGRLKEVAQ